MGAVQRALLARMIDGVTDYRAGESRAVRSLSRRGLVVSYVNRSGVRVIIATA